jgi:hypothetical protein
MGSANRCPQVQHRYAFNAPKELDGHWSKPPPAPKVFNPAEYRNRSVGLRATGRDALPLCLDRRGRPHKRLRHASQFGKCRAAYACMDLRELPLLTCTRSSRSYLGCPDTLSGLIHLMLFRRRYHDQCSYLDARSAISLDEPRSDFHQQRS